MFYELSPELKRMNDHFETITEKMKTAGDTR